MRNADDIVISPHAFLRAAERSGSEAEIRDVITNGSQIFAKHGGTARTEVYPFGKTRAGRLYPERRVVVYYRAGAIRILVVTVCVFCGRWEQRA